MILNSGVEWLICSTPEFKMEDSGIATKLHPRLIANELRAELAKQHEGLSGKRE